MPDPKERTWQKMIQKIPVEQHSGFIKKEIWGKHLPKKYTQLIFGGENKVRLSRGRLLKSYQDNQHKCLEILMWGYPSGDRGKLRENYLKNLDSIAFHAIEDKKPWKNYYYDLHKIGHLGISTISKLAYFYGCQFGGFPSLILDARIINTLKAGRWRGLKMPDITYDSAASYYEKYLELMSETGETLSCTSDQLELALFMFGREF